MSQVVVADAGPLIALARTGHLSLLEHLFERVLIPQAVADELELSSDRPGARALAQAIAPRSWLVVKAVHADGPLTSALGRGESEAILLASREDALLLIDDRKGRRAARAQGVRVIGTGRVLIAAKRIAASGRNQSRQEAVGRRQSAVTSKGRLHRPRPRRRPRPRLFSLPIQPALIHATRRA